MSQVSSPIEAVQLVKSNDNIFIQTAAGTPEILLNALSSRHQELTNVTFYSAHTEGEVRYANNDYAEAFNINCFFVGKNIRPYVQAGRAQYIPIFLSEIPHLFTDGIIQLDVAMITVSQPNEKGYCSLGCSVDATIAAVKQASKVIAQVNPNMPFTHGDGIIHISQIDAWIETDVPLFELAQHPITETEDLIGTHVASLIEDGATLQMGIGGIPNAALSKLGNHKHLGIHTEMFSDGIIDLVEKGVIDGSQKANHPGKIISAFVLGTRKVYDFIDHNPIVGLLDVSYVNDTRTIRKNPKVTAINSAIEIDIFGQVCADSIGHNQYSGVGGQMDFIRGASLSKGGKAILALPSRTGKGLNRIVSNLKPGASVVTTRAHVQYIVTEYGVAYLYGKNLKERAKAMVNIAHPDDRELLSKEIYEQKHLMI